MFEMAVVPAGFAIGAAFGAIGLVSGFCLLSSLRDWWLANDTRRVRGYAVAVAIAIAGTQIVAALGYLNIGKSLYLQPSFSFPLMFAGGLLFGLGMVLANACASRALVLLGKGNLRSLVVLIVIGIAAQITLKGLFGPARLAVLQATQITPSSISLPALIASIGIDETAARFAAGALVAGLLLIAALSGRNARKGAGQIAAGAAIGLLVTAGWLVTGWLGADEFNPVPVTSLTFISPVADSLQYAMFSTGLSVNFGIALVVGVVLGSAVAALLTGKFEFEGYNSTSHTARSLAGAALMGVGGAMAYGCSIGQGLTGISTLAIPSFVAVSGIIAGAALGLRARVFVPVLEGH